METTVEALENNRVKLTVTVDAKEIDARIKKTYKDFAHKYNFPGFRKGKAPRPVIDNALGAETVRATVTDEVINGLYPLAVDAENLYTTGQPNFGEPGLVEPGKAFVFVAEVDVKPEFELSSYDPVEISLPPEGATDAEIEQQIEALREHYYDLQDAPANTKVKEGSIVELEMSATDEAGKDIESITSESRLYSIGGGLLPEDFDNEIMGLKKGQEKEFSIAVPAQPTALTAALAGKTNKINFKVKVLVVKKKVLPEVTDEWVNETLGFESAEDFRARVAESIADQKSTLIPRMKENQCLDALAERLVGEAPEGMVEEAEATLLQEFFQQLQRQGMNFDAYLQQQGITADQFKEDVKQQAVDTAKQDLALDAWARHAGMTATDEEVSAEFAKSGAENPKALEEEWRRTGRLHLVRAGILRTNAIEQVMEQARVTELEPATADEVKEEKKAAKKPAAKKKAAKKEEKAEAEANSAE